MFFSLSYETLFGTLLRQRVTCHRKLHEACFLCFLGRLLFRLRSATVVGMQSLYGAIPPPQAVGRDEALLLFLFGHKGRNKLGPYTMSVLICQIA